MHARVVTAVQVAFETWYRTFRSDRGLSSTDSSSAQQTSYLEGSWQQVSPSGPPGTNRLSSNSQAYSMDIVGSPTGSSMVRPRRVDPRFMAPTPQYDPSPVVAGMGAVHRPHPTYPVDLQLTWTPSEALLPTITWKPAQISTSTWTLRQRMSLLTMLMQQLELHMLTRLEGLILTKLSLAHQEMQRITIWQAIHKTIGLISIQVPAGRTTMADGRESPEIGRN